MYQIKMIFSLKTKILSKQNNFFPVLGSGISDRDRHKTDNVLGTSGKIAHLAQGNNEKDFNNALII